MLLRIIYYGHQLLRKRALPIDAITDEIKQFAADMIETMDAAQGIGLAAPQVGRSIRLFVCRSYAIAPDGQWVMTEPRVYINPRLSQHSEEQVEDQEGCLSLPGIRAEVVRPLKVFIEALDLQGQAFSEQLEGYNARIRMHENDHLNGVLYIDRVNVRMRKRLEPLLQEIKKKYA